MRTVEWRRGACAALALLVVGCSAPNPCLPAGVFVLRNLGEATPGASFATGAIVRIDVPEEAGPPYWPGVVLAARDESSGSVLTWLAGGVRHTGELIGPVVPLNAAARARSTHGADLAPSSRLIAARDGLIDSELAATAERCIVEGE